MKKYIRQAQEAPEVDWGQYLSKAVGKSWNEQRQHAVNFGGLNQAYTLSSSAAPSHAYAATSVTGGSNVSIL